MTARMTPPSNAGGEGREVLFVLFYQPPNGRWYVHSHKLYRTHLDAVAAAAEFLHPGTPIAAVPFDTHLLALSAREKADDRAPALVEAAVAEMRERAAKVVDHYHDQIAEVLGQKGLSAKVLGQIVPMIQLADAMRAAIRALGTPSQEASNVG